MVRWRRVLRGGHHDELPARSRDLARRLERVATEPHELSCAHSRAACLSKGAEPRRPVRVRSLSPEAMRAKRKADYHHGRLRRALIETAVKTIAQHGVDCVEPARIGRSGRRQSWRSLSSLPQPERTMASIAEEGFARLEAQLIAARDAAADQCQRPPRSAGPCLCDVRRLVARLFPGDVPWRLEILGPDRGGIAHVPNPARRGCRLPTGGPRAEGRSHRPRPRRLVGRRTASRRCGSTAPCPFKALSLSCLAPEIGRLVTRMFAALARPA